MIRFATTPMMKGSVGDFQANCLGMRHTPDNELFSRDFHANLALRFRQAQNAKHLASASYLLPPGLAARPSSSGGLLDRPRPRGWICDKGKGPVPNGGGLPLQDLATTFGTIHYREFTHPFGPVKALTPVMEGRREWQYLGL